MHIVARNMQQMLPKITEAVMTWGVTSVTRAGQAHVMGEPVVIEYMRPNERVIFHTKRDANPFFHLYEIMWMLDGRRNVSDLVRFNSGMVKYSDDGVTLHGAYGYRWKRHWPMDQIERVVDGLKKEPTCRRQLLCMWDPDSDLGKDSKDIPCNIAVGFNLVENKLNMTVFNRSNDLVWGALGADCVHFSVLHEYMSARTGLKQGKMFQVSSNLHIYVSTADKVTNLGITADPYELGIPVIPLIRKPATFQKELPIALDIMGTPAIGFTEPFIKRVFVPMVLAYNAFRVVENKNRFQNALWFVDSMVECDWKLACTQWIKRRMK